MHIGSGSRRSERLAGQKESASLEFAAAQC